MCISLHCGSDHVNSPPRGLFFLPHATENSIVIGFPMILVCCGFIFFLGCCGFLLGRFGHDRAKNDSGIEFPGQSCEVLILLCVCSGWSLDYVGVGMKAWYA